MKNPTAALAAAAAVVTAALTGAAFWLSYEHLHDIASGNGLGGARAWAWPATVDAFILVGEILMLRAARKGRTDGWAIGLTAAGSLGSIALNVAGVGAHAGLMQYIVAAVPPTAALVAFGALMRQVHEHLAPLVATPADQSVATPATPPRPPAPPIALSLEDAVEEAMRTVAEDTETVRLLTVAEVAETKGVAEGTVRSWVSRNKLAPVQRDADGRLRFHPAAVAELD